MVILKNFLPTWKKITKKLEKINIKHKQIDDSDKESMMAFKIEGFPTVLLVKDGTTESVEYDGPREVDSLVKFAKDNSNDESFEELKNKQTMPQQEDLNSITDIPIINNSLHDDNSNNNEWALTLFAADWCGHTKNFMPTWNEVTSELDNMGVKHKLVKDTDRELMQKHRIQGFPTIKMVKGNTTESVEHNGGRSKDEVINFVKSVLNKPVESNNDANHSNGEKSFNFLLC